MVIASSLDKAIKLLLLGVLVVAGAYFAKPFLVPLVFGTVLAMLFLPMCRWLESSGIDRAIASFICVLSLLIIFAIIGSLLSWQISEIASDATNIEQKVNSWTNQLHQFVYEKFGIGPKKQEEMMQGQGSSLGSQIATGVETLMGTLIDGILVLV
jgi:predicted PurR-regulated permease PerM